MDTPPQLDPEETRVVACLVEKEATTPAQYPMTLNGVRLACNQVSNREPVVDYDDAMVERALRRLADRGFAKLVHRPGDRVVKYKHALDTVLEIGPEALAVLAVLMLRGAQTPGELRQRTDRYPAAAAPGAVDTALADLAHRDPPLVRRVGRRPGQKEDRYLQLLGVTAEGAAPDPGPPVERSAAGPDADGVPPPAPGTAAVAPADPIGVLAGEIAELRARFERLLDELGVEDV